MKIDRLLSIIIYLLNRDLVSARELADRFDVSLRTIQRDIETIDLAGIPIMSIQGPNGGYSIMENYKMDRRLMSMDDFYYIITALKGIGSSLEDKKIDSTIEKMTGLVPAADRNFSEKNEKLHIDFSMLGGNREQRLVLNTVQLAVESNRLLKFSYTNNKLETTVRTVEPMTIVFKWRAWYLFGYCRLKEDYRIFRAGRIRDPEILAERFTRRDKSFDDFETGTAGRMNEKEIDIRIRFSSVMRPMVEEFYSNNIENSGDGDIIVNFRMPENGWLYGYILSFGQFAEVLEPPHLRTIIRQSAEQIALLYD